MVTDEEARGLLKLHRVRLVRSRKHGIRRLYEVADVDRPLEGAAREAAKLRYLGRFAYTYREVLTTPHYQERREIHVLKRLTSSGAFVRWPRS